MIARVMRAFDVRYVVFELSLDVFDHASRAKRVDASVAINESFVG